MSGYREYLQRRIDEYMEASRDTEDLTQHERDITLAIASELGHALLMFGVLVERKVK